MRIECPFCGARDLGEFSYLGDAGFHRPAPDTEDLLERFHDAVYLRDNPAGPHQELWYHAGGCHCWVRIARDTRTHEILSVQFATEWSGR
jgi:methylglutamate dehydrogenase subunit B